MKKILVVYYTQSGQLRRILAALLRPLEASGKASITYEELRPKTAHPFPWKPFTFMDVQPESVLEVPQELELPGFDPAEDYDLIVLAYQVWFLSPSIPINSFLGSAVARRCMKDRPVVTVIGCRNMWLMAQERVKQRLNDLSARLVLNLPFIDRAPNAVSVFTIVAWMLTGRQNYFRTLPRAGVSDADIAGAARAGEAILEFLELPADRRPPDLFARIPAEVDPRLIGVEKRARKIFEVWARLIRSRGAPGNRSRNLWVRVFMVYLVLVIAIIFPLTYVVYRIQRIVNSKGLRDEVRYFSGAQAPDQ